MAFCWGDGAGEGSAAAAAAAAVDSACFGRPERGEGPYGGFAAAQAGGPRDAGAQTVADSLQSPVRKLFSLGFYLPFVGVFVYDFVLASCGLLGLAQVF